jgi:hypothetical protein
MHQQAPTHLQPRRTLVPFYRLIAIFSRSFFSTVSLISYTYLYSPESHNKIILSVCFLERGEGLRPQWMVLATVKYALNKAQGRSGITTQTNDILCLISLAVVVVDVYCAV